MTKVKEGDTVRINYTGKLEDGTVFDTSIGRNPLEFTVGKGKIMPEFEDALIGLSPGESNTAEIPSNRAFGPYLKELVVVVDKEHLPDEIDPKIGQVLEIKRENEESFIVTIKDISDSDVTLDANHPLAGKDLLFEIELLEIL